MRFIFLFIIASNFFCFNLGAQTSYKVVNFSDKYYAKVIVPEGYDQNDFDSHLYISISDKKTNQELLRVESHLDIGYELDGKDSISSNIVELPYGEQNVIICDDFNCDGDDDLAIKIGSLSCYGGPAYNVYIAAKGELKLHEELSRLAQEYCGFFEYDCESKEIYTMTKSGYGWLQYSTYSLIDGEPVIKEVIEDDAMGLSYSTRTIKTWTDGEESSKVYPLLDYSEPIFSFTLEKNNKQAIVYVDVKGFLVYILLNEDGEVEFDFTDDFFLTKKEGKDVLSFSNDGAEYSIYSNNSEVGIIVKTNGKSYLMKGDIESKENSLDIFYNETEVENLHVKEGLE